MPPLHTLPLRLAMESSENSLRRDDDAGREMMIQGERLVDCEGKQRGGEEREEEEGQEEEGEEEEGERESYLPRDDAGNMRPPTLIKAPHAGACTTLLRHIHATSSSTLVALAIRAVNMPQSKHEVTRLAFPPIRSTAGVRSSFPSR